MIDEIYLDFLLINHLNPHQLVGFSLNQAVYVKVDERIELLLTDSIFINNFVSDGEKGAFDFNSFISRLSSVCNFL